MNQTDVESILIEQLASRRDCTADEVRLELERLGGIDSLDGVDLAVGAERRFGIVISDDELETSCRSVSALARLIVSKS